MREREREREVAVYFKTTPTEDLASTAEYRVGKIGTDRKKGRQNRVSHKTRPAKDYLCKVSFQSELKSLQVEERVYPYSFCILSVYSSGLTTRSQYLLLLRLGFISVCRQRRW